MYDFPPLYPVEVDPRLYEEAKAKNKLGSGSYGDVYKRRNLRTREVFAIKRLKEFASSSYGLGNDKYNEIMLFTALQHRNVVRCSHIFLENARLCFAMDYCNLGSLSDLIRQGYYLTKKDRKHIYVQILRGLCYLHDNHVCHFDLKPDNVLLQAANSSPNAPVTCKLTDFGLALINGRWPEPILISPNKNYRWTAPYRPPEVWGEKFEIGFSSDIWSLGLTFLELITKRCLFNTSEKATDTIPLKIMTFMGASPDPELDWSETFMALAESNGRVDISSLVETDEISLKHLRATFFSDNNEDELAFLLKLLTYDPDKRLTARQALDDDFLAETNSLGNHELETILSRDSMNRLKRKVRFSVPYGSAEPGLKSNELWL